MSEKTAIEWTDHTFNIAWGCVKVSAGCDHCYADTTATRYGFDVWGPDKPRRTFGEKHWSEPIKWNREARKAGVRRKVFCSSMTDVFLNDPTIDAERDKLWPLIAQTEDLDWQVLTKHPERLKHTIPLDAYFRNLWLGVSVEDMGSAWRAETLRQTYVNGPRFLSLEPLLGPLEARVIAGMDWVIVGGESGPGARPMDLNWVRYIRDVCDEYGVAFFLKQLGGVRDKRGHDDAVLDGRQHKEFPRTALLTKGH